MFILLSSRLRLQGNEEPILRFEGQTVETVVGTKPNTVDGVGMSPGRSDYITDDEGGASLPGFARRFVQKIRTMVDHAIVKRRSQNSAIGVAAISERHVLS